MSWVVNTELLLMVKPLRGYHAVWSGKPQGSILGPLLFVIYINDLPDVVDVNTTVQLYADDSKYYRLISESVEQDQLQNDLKNLYSWSVDNSMKFNRKKCKHLCITKRKNPHVANYSIMALAFYKQHVKKIWGFLYRTICPGTAISRKLLCRLIRCLAWFIVLVVTTVINAHC